MLLYMCKNKKVLGGYKMRYYFRIISKNRCGCTTYTSWKYTEQCKSKAEVNRKFGICSKLEIYSEKQVNEQFVEEARIRLFETARCWD